MWAESQRFWKKPKNRGVAAGRLLITKVAVPQCEWFYSIARGTIVFNLPRVQGGPGDGNERRTQRHAMDQRSESGGPGGVSQAVGRVLSQAGSTRRAQTPCRVACAFDEEDVALSAFKSFCFGVAEERFPDLSDRGNLWAVLVIIATRKAQAFVETQNRHKRGGGKVRGDSVFIGREPTGELAGFDALAGNEPTPAFLAEAAESCDASSMTLEMKRYAA